MAEAESARRKSSGEGEVCRCGSGDSNGWKELGLERSGGLVKGGHCDGSGEVSQMRNLSL